MKPPIGRGGIWGGIGPPNPWIIMGGRGGAMGGRGGSAIICGCCCTTITGRTDSCGGRGGAAAVTPGAAVDTGCGTGGIAGIDGLEMTGGLDNGSGGSGGWSPFGIAGPIFSFSSSWLESKSFVNTKSCNDVPL